MEWMDFFHQEQTQEYYCNLKQFIEEEYQTKTIYPSFDEIFHAFDETPLSMVKVVIIGQDPYHEPNQAMGLSFSVPNDVAIPKSLINIYKELYSDLGIAPKKSGDLSSWAKQGVFLLNSILTVRAHEAGSHKDKGWEKFTTHAIQYINDHCEHVVFILWGNYAREKKKYIDAQKHLILESAHPSPLSVYHGFWGSKPFSKANEYLLQHGKEEIKW